MSRVIIGGEGQRNVPLPGGWNLNDEDEVVVSDAEWDLIQADPEIFLRVIDGGTTSDPITPVPTWRDIQWAIGGGGGGTPGLNGRGVVSIEKTGTAGLVDTYTITYDQAPLTSTFTLTNGADGEGTPGLSAYEIAVINGFVGSESAWLDSLHGEDGDDGVNLTQMYDSPTPPPGPNFPYLRFHRDGDGDVQAVYLGTVS